MEEGSLLQQALHHRRGLEGETTLLVDVYWIGQVDSIQDHWLQLASLAVTWNQALQALNYPWFAGGDGPVFGVHASSSSNLGDINKKDDTLKSLNHASIPHLRAACIYGTCVADEWKLIQFVMHQSIDTPHVAVEVWDVEDGQVLLIESAHHLPAWVDEHGPEWSRHVCWIRQGHVGLIPPHSSTATSARMASPMTRQEALQCLYKNGNSRFTVIPSIQMCIRNKLQSLQDSLWKRHTAAVALPRAVADMWTRRPDLMHSAMAAFAHHAADELPYTPLHTTLAGPWVWCTGSFSRTAYALMRHQVTPPHWMDSTSVPPRYQSPSLQRLRRLGACDATPHVHAAVGVGVRIVAGLDHLLQQQQQNSHEKQPAAVTSQGEHRVLHAWVPLLRQQSLKTEMSNVSASNSIDPAAWIVEAWRAGPQKSRYNLDAVLKCPVYETEVHGLPTPLSHPDQSIQQQLRRELQKEPSVRDYSMPRASEVDSEEWMNIPLTDEEMDRHGRVQSFAQQGVKASRTDDMQSQEDTARQIMDTIHAFTNQKSEVQGFSGNHSDHEPARINPTLFLQLFHHVLQAPTAKDIVFPNPSNRDSDPYFLREDYDALDDSDDEEGEVDDAILETMDVMDEELRQRSNLFSPNHGDTTHAGGDSGLNQEFEMLSNLLMSMEATTGSTGPVQNILKEMGLEAPDVVNEE
jgi:hypothetical protein